MSILRVQSIPVAPEPLGTGARAPPLWDMAIGTEGHRRASFETRHASRRDADFYRRRSLEFCLNVQRYKQYEAAAYAQLPSSTI